MAPKSEIEEMLDVQNGQLKKFHEIVLQSIQEEDVLVSNLLNPPVEKVTTGQRISDQVAKFGGSWTFIISFMIILFAWIILNSIIPQPDRFDPFPFILMNLILSCVAALQAPIIMMSQNRQEEKDRTRAENDYMINLKAELEVRSLHQKVDLLLEEQIKTLFEIQAKQMEMLTSLNEKLDTLCSK
ncbi:DUF1003 domain-containing protein [Dyadobacter sp. 32]|uniref:DUF1003 domain-containing protein n=1 Tax=Dyadobacter sp. 32 TaxID=538966 RepID=UPI0011EC1553